MHDEMCMLLQVTSAEGDILGLRSGGFLFYTLGLRSGGFLFHTLGLKSGGFLFYTLPTPAKHKPVQADIVVMMINPFYFMLVCLKGNYF